MKNQALYRVKSTRWLATNIALVALKNDPANKPEHTFMRAKNARSGFANIVGLQPQNVKSVGFHANDNPDLRREGR